MIGEVKVILEAVSTFLVPLIFDGLKKSEANIVLPDAFLVPLFF